MPPLVKIDRVSPQLVQNRGHLGGWTANRGRAPSSYQAAWGQAFGPAQTNAMATFGSASAHPVANDQAEEATGTGFGVGSGCFTHVVFGPQAGPNAARGTLIFGVPMGSTGGNAKAATTDVPGGGGVAAAASTTKGPGGSSSGGTLVSGTSGVNLSGVPTSDGDAKTEEARESSTITKGGGASTASVIPFAQLPDTAPASSVPAAKLEIPKSSNKGNQKNKNKPYCFRCYTKGHTINECTTILKCDICFGDHVKKVCPNLKSLNVSVNPCGYAVEGLGFYHIPVTENSKSKDLDTSAIVRVLDGSPTTEDLAVELENLMPGMKDWVVEEKGSKTFYTYFPSLDVLNCVIKIGA